MLAGTVEAAMDRQALALLGQLDAACAAASGLEQAATESSSLHPDAGIIISFPVKDLARRQHPREGVTGTLWLEVRGSVFGIVRDVGFIGPLTRCRS
jgi:hypothetical protein